MQQCSRVQEENRSHPSLASFPGPVQPWEQGYPLLAVQFANHLNSERIKNQSITNWYWGTRTVTETETTMLCVYCFGNTWFKDGPLLMFKNGCFLT